MKKFPAIIIALSLPITIVLTNLLALTFSDAIYKGFFTNSEEIHFALNVVNNLRVGIGLDSGYFSPQAITHMADVKNLFDAVKAANAIILFVLFATALYLISRKKFKQLERGILLGAVITTLAILAAFIMSILNFDFAFVLFHKIFFRNDVWLFPPDDTLVNLFSLNFFIFFIQKLTVNILLTLLIILILLKFTPTNDSKNN